MSQPQSRNNRKSTKQVNQASTPATESVMKVEQSVVEQSAVPTVPVVSQPVVEQAAVPVVSSRKTKSAQQVAPVADVVPVVSVVQPVVESSAVVDSVVPAVSSQVVEVQEVNHFENLNQKLKQVQSLLRDLTTELNVLQKEVDRLKKSSKKQSSKSRAKSKVSEDGTVSTTTRSGINKEVNVSEDLAKFLGIDADTKVSRIQVSKAISEYITKHNLQNPSDRRNILLDETLTKLFNPPQDVVVSYFNMQTFLKPHYRQ